MTGRKVGTTEQREVGKWEGVGSMSNAHGGGVVVALLPATRALGLAGEQHQQGTSSM